MLILAIETSCDETAASIIRGENSKIEVLSNIVSSQVKLHAEWGGVVPNLAAREHVKNILPVIDECLLEAKISKEDLDLLAIANGPGLIPALLVGTNAAKTLSYVWEKPLIGIHHIEGHIYSNFIGEEKIEFPALSLVVSGGHTQLIYMKDHLSYEIIGQTQDDAVGEAFDKVARILDLGYPGGPIVSEKAAENSGDHKIILPRPMITSKDFNFSFSGLKTAVLYLVKKNEEKKKDPTFINAVCKEFQQAAIDVLISKTLSAANKLNPKSLLLAGGVSANKELRQQLENAIQAKMPNTRYFCPELKYTGDNAVMIATAAYFHCKQDKNALSKLASNWKSIQANANLKL